jgi:hypothetical protein
MIIDQVYVLKADTYIGGIAVLLHSECRGIKLASTYRAQNILFTGFMCFNNRTTRMIYGSGSGE